MIICVNSPYLTFSISSNYGNHSDLTHTISDRIGENHRKIHQIIGYPIKQDTFHVHMQVTSEQDRRIKT